MTDVIHQIAPHVWAIITYEDTWKSYINSYVIQSDDKYLLIDTNMKKHRQTYLGALQELGVTQQNINGVYLTHRHSDHIGNVESFRTSNNWIHLHDFFELDDFSQTLFGHTFAGSKGDLSRLEYLNLSYHTEGSVVYFDRNSGTCFTGDHICFFGDPMDEVMGLQQVRREIFLESLDNRQKTEPERVEAFADGIRQMMEWPIEILATGHGAILKGDVHGFFGQILEMTNKT
ncbi:MBL fold metallo-hydrolase [Brevibacillus dissolubilis]|uniref:MBL fold metallo-hydrolase n=1 Tax=Brevibacillus dissolubilis TaxID=1844116 RepID=UPI0011161EFB|nr:MBL fold metallo-hydrolase [Brevibacillus dissolubilis]